MASAIQTAVQFLEASANTDYRTTPGDCNYEFMTIGLQDYFTEIGDIELTKNDMVEQEVVRELNEYAIANCTYCEKDKVYRILLKYNMHLTSANMDNERIQKRFPDGIDSISTECYVDLTLVDEFNDGIYRISSVQFGDWENIE